LGSPDSPGAAPAPGGAVRTALRALIVEDSEFDAKILVSLLRKGGYEVASHRVESAEQMRAALQAQSWDLILCDYNLPAFNAPDALKLLQETGLDVPFLIVSGGIGEDIAVAAMKAGAHDYLMKGNLNRLAPAVDRELREAANRAAQRAARKSMLESETRYRLLWQTCPDAVVLMDAAGRIHFANPAVKEVFGCSPDEVIGQPLTHLQPERLRGDPEGGLDCILAGGVRRPHRKAVETLGLRQDGAEIPVEVSFSELELNGERRYVGFIRDITERLRAERELREHQEQFAAAREIQQRLFPKSAPSLPGFDIAGASYPMEATGGDYFDYLPMLHDRLGIVMGDVTGHGVGAALIMAETRAYLRVLAGRREDVGEILTRTNGILSGDLGGEQFVTLFLGRLDPATRKLVYVSAGHPAGYVLGADGAVKHKLRRTGIALGLGPDTTYAAAPEIELARGDLLLLVTDGLAEAQGPDESLFGTERILDTVRARQNRPAREIVEALYQAVREFSQHQPQMDDVTAKVVKVL
jgi:PAS domain S-box-containing protein